MPRCCYSIKKYIIKQKTAILIFAQTGKQEEISKPFYKSAVLFNELNKQTISKVEKTGLPYFHFSEKLQKGNTFGQRYLNAIEQVYSQGFENVITIGNDTPHLTTKTIIKAAKKLETNTLVLGPSRDGGYYLLGINKAHFNSFVFVKLPWQTAQLTQSIVSLFRIKNIEISFLKNLEDIDNVQDAKGFLNTFQQVATTILKILKAIFYSEIVLFEILEFIKSTFQQKNYFNKGSPLFAISAK